MRGYTLWAHYDTKEEAERIVKEYGQPDDRIVKEGNKFAVYGKEA